MEETFLLHIICCIRLCAYLQYKLSIIHHTRIQASSILPRCILHKVNTQYIQHHSITGTFEAHPNPLGMTENFLSCCTAAMGKGKVSPDLSTLTVFSTDVPVVISRSTSTLRSFTTCTDQMLCGKHCSVF